MKARIWEVLQVVAGDVATTKVSRMMIADDLNDGIVAGPRLVDARSKADT